MAEEQLVLFKLAEEEYAIAITQVKEIILYNGATRLPNVPEYVEGIINLRGKTLPVINLAQRLALTDVSFRDNKKALIIETDKQEFGIVVDEVTEVLLLEGSAIEAAPEISNNNWIRGIGKAGDRLLILLDMNYLFGSEEVGQLNFLLPVCFE